MALTWSPLISSIFVFSFVAAYLSSASQIPRGGGAHRPMIFPLYFTSPKSSRHPQDIEGNLGRRRLKSDPHKHPSARMGLYDDLLSNGYYTTRLWIGTPPQQFALIVDTGSTVTYVPCSDCQHCGKHQTSNYGCDSNEESVEIPWFSVWLPEHYQSLKNFEIRGQQIQHPWFKDPRFQPDLSSTYHPVKCNMDCNCDNDGVNCVYERRYAEMSSSSGVLGEDVISFGNKSELAPQRAVFGCETVETGDLYSQRADGIMGLGRGQLSVVDQLVEKNVINDSFSLCYGGMHVGGGAMVLGGIPLPPDMVFSHSNPFRSPYYNIELKEIHVAGEPLKLSPKIFDRKHGTVLDSGTTYAYLPEEAFVAFKDAVIKKSHNLKQIHGPDPNYHDICFSGAGRDISQLSKTFPTVDMVFSNGQKLSLTPENYLFQHTKIRGGYCLGIFQNGDSTTLLGGIIVRNTLVTYDRENEKIGFWKTNCSELWQRLHVSGAPAPVSDVPTSKSVSASPPVLYSKNKTTAGMAPAVAPSGLPQKILPGEFQVGLITFDMSFNVNYSNMKPNFTELTMFIAHELEINASQVHFLNFFPKGNHSIIRWGIFPAESATYISNSTASSIISQLMEHRVHLPERFGSYQLVEWKVEPQIKRTWWEQHLWAIVVGVLITLVLGLSAFGVWVVRRRQRNALGTYIPVGAKVPEQELQQLTSIPNSET